MGVAEVVNALAASEGVERVVDLVAVRAQVVVIAHLTTIVDVGEGSLAASVANRSARRRRQGDVGPFFRLDEFHVLPVSTRVRLCANAAEWGVEAIAADVFAVWMPAKFAWTALERKAAFHVHLHELLATVERGQHERRDVVSRALGESHTMQSTVVVDRTGRWRKRRCKAARIRAGGRRRARSIEFSLPSHERRVLLVRCREQRSVWRTW